VTGEMLGCGSWQFGSCKWLNVISTDGKRQSLNAAAVASRLWRLCPQTNTTWISTGYRQI